MPGRLKKRWGPGEALPPLTFLPTSSVLGPRDQLVRPDPGNHGAELGADFLDGVVGVAAADGLDVGLVGLVLEYPVASEAAFLFSPFARPLLMKPKDSRVPYANQRSCPLSETPRGNQLETRRLKIRQVAGGKAPAIDLRDGCDHAVGRGNADSLSRCRAHDPTVSQRRFLRQPENPVGKATPPVGQTLLQPQRPLIRSNLLDAEGDFGDGHGR